MAENRFARVAASASAAPRAAQKVTKTTRRIPCDLPIVDHADFTAWCVRQDPDDGKRLAAGATLVALVQLLLVDTDVQRKVMNQINGSTDQKIE